MQESIKTTIIKHKMLTPGDSVIIGLSGGADSVALLHILLELRDELKLSEIIPVHINHNLRGDESASDESFVSELCADLNLPLATYQADVKALADVKNLGIEESGRILRYAFMDGARIAFNAQKIAVGHNQDDNAETVLMNLCRGSGLKGLCGIPPLNGNIVRPLIETSRAQIEKYLQVKKIPFITDASNNSNEYTRNRVRHNVIPVLETNINPNASVVIARNATWLKADEDYLESIARKALEDLDVFDKTDESSAIISSTGDLDVLVTTDASPVKSSLSSDLDVFDTTGANPAKISIARLLALPEAIARRVIRYAIGRAKGGKSGDNSDGNHSNSHDLTDISAAHIMAVLSLAQGNSGREIHLPGLVVKKEYDALIFVQSSAPSGTSSATESIGFCYPLEPDSSIYIPELGKTISLSREAPSPETPNLYCTKAFEYDIVDMTNSQLNIRTRQKGDRITFEAGDKSGWFTKKLQDYFTDAKIPASQRDGISLLAIGNDILWIISQNRVNAKYTPKTGNLIWISLWEGKND